MPYSDARAQEFVAARLQQSGRTLYLRRAGVDRPIIGMIINYSPRERASGLIQATSRRAILSADDTSIAAPDDQLDMLVVPASQSQPDDTLLRFVMPVGRIEPGAVTLLYDAQVQEVGLA